MPNRLFSLTAVILAGSLLATACASTASQSTAESDRERVYAALGEKADGLWVSDIERNRGVIRFVATNTADESFDCVMKHRLVSARINAPQDLELNNATADVYECEPRTDETVSRIKAALGEKAEFFALSEVRREGRQLRFVATNDVRESFDCRLEKRVLRDRNTPPEASAHMMYKTKEFYSCSPLGTDVLTSRSQ